MASVYISIETDTVLNRFHRAMTQACSIASDMIEVKTAITDDAVIKIIRTECPWAIAIFRSLKTAEV